MARKSGKSKGSRNSGKSEGSDRSKKIDLDKEGSAIDLDKNDDISLGDKESDSSNFGEFSQEIELWSDDEGNSVSGVIGVDVVPLGLNISANGDIGTVGIDIGLPGDVIGIGGSLNVNMETGEIVGGAGNIDYGGASVEVDVRKSDGETCTSITITYFGVGVSYQRCKKDDEDDEKDPKKDPPPPKGEEDDLEPIPPPPQENPLPGNPDDYVYYFFTQQTAKQNKRTWFKYGKKTLKWQHRWEGHDSLTYQNGYGQEIFPPIRLLNGSLKYRYSNENGVYCESEDSWSNGEGTHSGLYCEVWSFNWSITQASPFTVIEYSGLKKHFNFPGRSTSSSWNIHHTQNLEYYGEESWEAGNEWSVWNLAIAYVNDQPVEISPPEKPKEPDPPIPPEDDMSNCCDLGPVMSLLRKVSTAIGTDQLPAMMPKSFLKNEGFRKIPSLAELAVYHIEIMDQLIGKFPIELEIVDTDPLTPGDQTKKVVLQNLAESIAELFGLAINSSHDNAIQTTGTIKNLLEITLVRQAVLQNYYRLDAILDYLGAGLEEDEATFNSTISLPKDPNNISEDVAEFLQQSEIKFAYDKLADPKNTLTAKLLPIQKAADIIKAKYWKGFGKAGGDYTGAIKEWLKTYDPKNEQNDTDWKDKIDKILEEYAKDATGNIDKDRMPTIQNITQIGSEPAPPPPGV